jgi:hypothetical protein
MDERGAVISKKNDIEKDVRKIFITMLLLLWVYERTLSSVTSLPLLALGHSPAPSFDKLRTGSAAVIDWSETLRTESVIDVDQLIALVSAYPRASGIRVYLPSVAHRASMQRLQRSLQSMGCTVTLRVTQGKALRARPA